MIENRYFKKIGYLILVMVWALELLKKMGRAFELPKSRAEPSFSKHASREPNFEPKPRLDPALKITKKKSQNFSQVIFGWGT